MAFHRFSTFLVIAAYILCHGTMNVKVVLEVLLKRVPRDFDITGYSKALAGRWRQ
jgi:hypothetical protein